MMRRGTESEAVEVSGADPRGAGDRYAGAIEAVPDVAVQALYRWFLRRSERGRNSPTLDVDLTALLREAQRGECDPEEAREMFVSSAGHWALLTGFGVVAAILVDFLSRGLSNVVVILSLSVFPAFALLSFVDAMRARALRDAEAERRKKRKRQGKKRRPIRCYHPIGNRWIIPLATSVLLLPVWIVIFFAG
ncbi:hypothetical protein [Streptomyces sp. NPDC059452]|uniref:hypothetical protein n=1 Tax=Streptomyces sp. NPDC059452 TaxID=3346835 RepID=UPI0036925321